MLAVSGDLDPTPGGPHPFPTPKTWAFTQHNPFTAVYDHNRRSVYLMTQRIKRHPFLALFDGADPNSCTGRRDSTTVPTQALFFLNDPFVHARADEPRPPARGPARRPARLDRACRLLFGRPPREVEADRRGAGSSRRTRPSPGDAGRAHRTAWAGWLRVHVREQRILSTWIDRPGGPAMSVELARRRSRRGFVRSAVAGTVLFPAILSELLAEDGPRRPRPTRSPRSRRTSRRGRRTSSSCS